MLLIHARCWCARSDVQIPVSWIREGKTEPCAYPGCGPGCEMAPDEDEIEIEIDEQQLQIPTNPVTPMPRRQKMNTYNPDTYDPASDSTPGLQHRGDAVVLASGQVHKICPCGCGEAPKGAKATFGMGHDIRLRGKLARAAGAKKSIVTIDVETFEETEYDPILFAGIWTTPAMDWIKTVKASVVKITTKRKPTVKKKPKAKPAQTFNPGIGDRRKIKVGRWEYNAKIVDVADDGAITFEYVDGKDRVRTAEQVDGKIKVTTAA